MEKYDTLMIAAKLQLKNADHMASVTYQVVNDPKLLMAIAEKLYNSLTYAISSLLHRDYLFKVISNLPENFGDQLRLFQRYSINKYNLNKEIITLVKELQELVEFRKKSPVEFIKRGDFIVCSSGYNTKSINLKKMKQYVSQVKLHIQEINNVLIKNGL